MSVDIDHREYRSQADGALEGRRNAAGADLSERRRILLTVVEAVYVDTRDTALPVTIKPKAAFQEVIRASAAVASAI